MTVRIITFESGAEPIGEAVVAIGVFDGVHTGHQSLLREAVADAKRRGTQAVAVTFDRDPDQVVSPGTAAPQLLTLADKLAAISSCGVDAIVVVPFTAALAQLDAEAFVDKVLCAALTPLAVHVGSDFRFGRMAAGDVSALRLAGATRGFEVCAHDLVSVDGEPVTSTRIRGLVANGKIADAVRLLGGHPCVSGSVHRGRGEGAGLGFPTANVVPVPFAALPAAGVYAGRAVLADGSAWASAISVGTPPMFPQAKDYLEAHLISFEGDLYDQPITLEFWERLRDQQSYASLDELKVAIAADVDRALEIAGFTDKELAASAHAGASDDDAIHITDHYFQPKAVPVLLPFVPLPSPERRAELEAEAEDDSDPVSDPAALEAAEKAAMAAPDSFGRMATGEWKPILTRNLTPAAAGAQSFALTVPLDAANIPYCWDPFPPQDATSATRDISARAFTLLVPAALVDQARAELEAAVSSNVDDTVTDEWAGEEGIDDPIALENAERAVQGLRPTGPHRHPGKDWVEVLSGLPFDKRRFHDVDAALTAADIDHIWDPYAPQEAPLIRIDFFDVERFSLTVPDGQEDAAAEIIAQVDDANAEHW